MSVSETAKVNCKSLPSSDRLLWINGTDPPAVTACPLNEYKQLSMAPIAYSSGTEMAIPLAVTRRCYAGIRSRYRNKNWSDFE